ncbi:unnamed protein product [Peronospora destructor]|uniref:Uncharacterized protein n=1 Tax=Peronospora destructor TaxID=86335 RepID=A0AAV0UDQ1_9STRA|nr:unnamed protein product [Peronospora destructor]
MSETPASTSHACFSLTKALPMLHTRMRSPTIIRDSMRLVRPREPHLTLRTKDVQKRLHEVEDDHVESALVAAKRTRYVINAEKKTPSDQHFDSKAAVEALQASKEDDGYTGYMEGLHHQKKVAQYLDQDLLRENARMRLKILHLKDEVDFYYRILTRIELLATQKRRESEGKSNQEQERVTKLSEQIQHVISAPKPLDRAIQLTPEQLTSRCRLR